MYGSLLLRGALAAAHAENRDGSVTLLDEAGQAGSRLGSDYNHRWTAFGPANVLLHRVNAAVRLGDAGSAINYAREINLDQLTVTERRASFFVDTAQAFGQWGKHEKAFRALRAAEELAPQEVRSRPPSAAWSATCSPLRLPPSGPTSTNSLPASGLRDETTSRGPGSLCDRVRSRTRRRGRTTGGTGS